MNIPRGLCSYCQESFLNCKCEQFHPTIKEEFTLSEDEVLALLDYFINRAGYISQEFDSRIHLIIERLNDYEKRIDQPKVYPPKSKEQ